MANYYASARSNYFKVKDAEAFKAWVGSTPNLGLWEKDGMFALYSTCPDSGGWPSWYLDDDGDELYFEVTDVAEFLTEDSIAVFMESGAEKLRYITGYAVAVNHKGETVQIGLGDIYELARAKFGIEPTVAEY